MINFYRLNIVNTNLPTTDISNFAEIIFKSFLTINDEYSLTDYSILFSPTQDAIMDLIDKVNKLTDEVTSKSKNLAQMGATAESTSKMPRTPEPNKTPNKVSVVTAATLAAHPNSAATKPGARARIRKNGGDSEVVAFRLNAALESATFRLMTSKVPALATMSVRNLR